MAAAIRDKEAKLEEYRQGLFCSGCGKLQPELRTIAEGYVQKSRKQSGDEALASLQSAEDADPTYREIYVDRMERASWNRSDQTGFENALKGFSRRETSTVDAIKRIRNIHEWLKKPQFVAFMNDLMGRDQVEALRNSWSAAEVHKTLNDLVTKSKMTMTLSSKMDWRNWAYKKSEKWSVSRISNASPCVSKISLQGLLYSSSGSSKLTTEYNIDWRKFSSIHGNNNGIFLANDSTNETAVAFSLSVDDRDTILVDLIRYHEFCRPYTAWFGLSYKFAEPANSQKLGLPVNVIEGIEPGGPADKAGLAAGDMIGAINGRSSLDIVGETVKGASPGMEYKVSFLRSGKWKNTVIQAAARPIY